jgi:hypothetical protein
LGTEERGLIDRNFVALGEKGAELRVEARSRARSAQRERRDAGRIGSGRAYGRWVFGDGKRPGRVSRVATR